MGQDPMSDPSDDAQAAANKASAMVAVSNKLTSRTRPERLQLLDRCERPVASCSMRGQGIGPCDPLASGFPDLRPRQLVHAVRTQFAFVGRLRVCDLYEDPVLSRRHVQYVHHTMAGNARLGAR
jgi:hypothetical protein